MKISKRVRDEAIWCADIGASDAHRSHALDNALTSADPRSRLLYWKAWEALNEGPYKTSSALAPEHDAEVAQILRDGWSPGDPLEVRS